MNNFCIVDGVLPVLSQSHRYRLRSWRPYLASLIPPEKTQQTLQGLGFICDRRAFNMVDASDVR